MTQKTINVHEAFLTGFISEEIARNIVYKKYDHVYHKGVRVEA